MSDFAGKVVVITGAGSGIWKAAAMAFASQGASLVLADINVAAGEELAGALARTGRTSVFIHADVSSPEDCMNMIQSARKRLGRLDVAINNAGVCRTTSPNASPRMYQWTCGDVRSKSPCRVSSTASERSYH